jgi:transcriptional regulator with XRE-family HTH domain
MATRLVRLDREKAREARRAAGNLSQAAVAAVLGTAQPHISTMEAGRPVSRTVLLAYAYAVKATDAEDLIQAA